jgi:hypothetical protein
MSSTPEQRLGSMWYTIQVLAAGSALEGSDEWAYRRITREYSQKFNVPLDEVRRRPFFKDVLFEVLESRLDGVNRSELMERVRAILMDEDSEQRAADERTKRYEEEEKLRLERQAKRKPRVKKQRVTANMAPAPSISKTYSMGDPDEY